VIQRSAHIHNKLMSNKILVQLVKLVKPFSSTKSSLKMIFRRNLSYIIYERYRIGHIFGKNLRE